MALCRCSSLYQVTKSWTQSRAAVRLAKREVGDSGRYLRVLKRASEKGLSLLALGRLNEGRGSGSDTEQFEGFHAARLRTAVRCVARSLAMAASQRSLSASARKCRT
jgi:hypothetical protein